VAFQCDMGMFGRYHEDVGCVLVVQRERQRHRRAGEETTFPPFAKARRMGHPKGFGWLNEGGSRICANAHLSDDKAVAKMGTRTFGARMRAARSG